MYYAFKVTSLTLCNCYGNNKDKKDKPAEMQKKKIRNLALHMQCL